MQESIRQLEDEQENSLQLSNAAFVPGAERHTPRYMKVLNDTQLKEIMKLREQLREAEEHTERVKRTVQRKVEELRAQVLDKDKIIESLESQVSATRKELSKVSNELADTRSDRDSQAQTNAQVIKQISSMKAVIEDFKERELEKEQLLIKIKQKDEKIRELQKSPRDMMDSGKMNDELMRLKEENERLNSLQATVRITEI
jgi:chromosome segregation ATPase